MQRLQQEDNRLSGGLTGSYTNVGGSGQQQYYGHVPQAQQQQPYLRQANQQSFPGTADDINRDPSNRTQYGSPYSNQNQSYPSPTHSSTPNYPQANNVPANYPMVNNGHSQMNSGQGMQHPLNMNINSNMTTHMNNIISNNNQRLDDKLDRIDARMEQRGYATPSTGLLREDVFRQSQGARHDEIMRYPSTNNVRISEAQIQSSRGSEELNRHQEIRNSKSEDILKHHHQGEMQRYASSGNIRAHDINQPLRQNPDHLHQHRLSNEERILRGQAKLAEMGEEVRRRQQHQQPQNRLLGQMPANSYYQQQQQHYYNNQMAQSLQNLSINPTYQNHQQHPATSSAYSQHYQPNSGYQTTPTTSNFYQAHGPTSPTYRPQTAVQKQTKKTELPPELPPTNTHPLYSPSGQDPSGTYTASNQDPPKMAFYAATSTTANSKPPRDPWAREEQERQQEARREASRQWQEQQIRELISLPYRTAQQEEQLRVLQLEKEFQRRAQEAAGEDDDDTEKESPTPHMMPQPVSSQTVISTVPSATVSSRQEATQPPPTSILKPGGSNSQPPPPVVTSNSRESHITNLPSPSEIIAPPPPERGSSFAVMSMRSKEAVSKRVSFDTPTTPNNVQLPQPTPNILPIEESTREDPNSFIRQAESMLASPTTPTDPSLNVATATPGVIGAQEVYRDPRARRLAEQQKKSQNESTPVPEKLSFKEKMKMFAMETGEQETPKDKNGA